MIFLRSVVGKLWFTILLLVSFVLLILTVMLLEFVENFYVQQVESELLTSADRIAAILEQRDDPDETLEISSELLGASNQILIVEKDQQVFSSMQSEQGDMLSLETVQKDEDLSRIFNGAQMVKKEINHPSGDDNLPAIVVGVQLGEWRDGNSVLFVSQSLDSMKSTTDSTKKFILLAAGVAIILTTIFAFFLSTRITAPLRKMREAAFNVARGRFDTKVPTPSSDEIGELAAAFNQMGRQLKYSMNALSQEKENLASVLSSMADGVITMNIDGTILVTNPPADLFLQLWYKQEDSKLSGSEFPPQLNELFKRSVKDEQEQIGEIQVAGHYWVIIVSPLYNKQNIRGVVAVLRDMTEDRKLEKMKNDFIANVSHELRTPISMLQGYSEAIIDDIAESKEEKQEMARIIYDESLRMGRLVNELLDLARMEAGHMHLNYESVELRSYMKRVTNKFAGISKEKKVHLEVETTSDQTYWILDADRIEQVLTNLIDNAIRHTPEGGSVKVSQTIEDRLLRVEVTDTGSGIPEEDIPFVFERFYKADKARTRERSGKGTGLGLAIAKNIVKSHNGDIQVKSLENRGTTFFFTIPMKEDFNEKGAGY